MRRAGKKDRKRLNLYRQTIVDVLILYVNTCVVYLNAICLIHSDIIEVFSQYLNLFQSKIILCFGLTITKPFNTLFVAQSFF